MAGTKREEYFIEIRGDCLGQLAPAGTVIHLVPGAEIQSGDLVAIIIDSSKPGPWGEFGRSISDDDIAGVGKIFLSLYERDGETMGLFGQLNPPGMMVIPMSAVLAVDRANFQGECAGHDREALEMLRPFMTVQIYQKEGAQNAL
jgi:hypothetical protein